MGKVLSHIIVLTCLCQTASTLKPDVGVMSAEQLGIDDQVPTRSKWRIA